jgi:tetratricopeptide (TPR) repeat protein
MRVLVFLLISSIALAQNQVKLDSLQLQLQNTDVDSLKIQTLLEISNHYFNYNFVLAAEYAQQARDLSTKKGLSGYEAKSNRALGLTLFNMGDYKNATSHYFKALKFYETVGDTSSMMVMNFNLGAVFDRLKEFDQALVYYFKVQSFYNQLNTVARKNFPLASLYNNIANIYQAKGDFESALQYYENALELAKETQDKWLQGIALNNIGKLYFTDMHQPEKAIGYLIESLRTREEAGDKSEIARSMVILSSYYFEQKKLEDGKRYAENAISLGIETGSLEIQENAYHSLSDIEAGLGRYKESLVAYKKYKSLRDSIQSQSTASEITRLQLQYDFEKAEQIQNQEQQQTRDRYIVTIIILAACLMVAVLIVILVRSRARQTELKRKNLAQDVEIKNKELTTNVMYLIRKNELINSVAERLLKVQAHARVEDTKLVHDIIVDLQKEADNDSWKEFELRFNQVHSDFYINLRKLYPGLSPAEEKLCAFLRLNMSSKEIAAITQQSIKSVEVARARLRKKLNLTNTTSNLVTHLANL